MMIFPLFAVDNSVFSEKVLLIEGTFRSEGLPGFSKNHIPSLFGKYETENAKNISVWGVNEPLVFDMTVWSITRMAQYPAVYATNTSDSRVWVVQRTLAMRDEMTDNTKWFFVFGFDLILSERYCAAFVEAFIMRTEFFFSSVRRFSDLSFPATLTVTGK